MSEFNVQMEYQRLIVGYHGCDRQVAEGVLLGGESLRKSHNLYDWLGEGIYFWEYGPRRALEFAFEQQERGKVESPFVLGAYIHLGRCFDLTDTQHTQLLAESFKPWSEYLKAAGRTLPENKRAPNGSLDLLLRNRDCAVINWYLKQMDKRQEAGYYSYQTVRGVFVEGEPVYENAGIHTKSHVQIAVRDPACIIGYFRPGFLTGGHDEEK